MKKKVFAFLLLLSFSYINFSGHFFASTSKALDTSSWFIYNGSVGGHDFSFLFPSDWEVISGINTQKITSNNSDTPQLILDEFSNQNFENVKKVYKDKNYEVIEEYDQILETNSEPLLIKVILAKKDGKEYKINLLKRGKSTLAILDPQISGETANEIIKSFTFEDPYHQYLDFKGQYAFVFHNQFTPNITSDGVKLNSGSAEVLGIKQYSGTNFDETLEILENQSWAGDSQEKITLNDEFSAQKVTLRNKSTNKKATYLFVEISGDTFQIGNINQPDFQSEIENILASFYFFKLSGESGGDSTFTPYQYFPDVNDNHPNEKAINKLKKEGIINGYPDGSYKPDRGINRAELTKLVIEATTTPKDLEGYKNCFDDVGREWFAKYVCYAEDKGYVEGYNGGDFKPGKKVNRAEALKIIQEVLYNSRINPKKSLDSEVSDIKKNDWFAKYYRLADERDSLDLKHIQKNSNGFKYFPAGDMSRKEVAEMIYRIKY